MIDKTRLIERCDRAFDTELGRKIEKSINRAIEEFNMKALIERGVLVGFSGGPDSVLLLIFLRILRKKSFNFDIKAIHINHMIRGEDANADEKFAFEFARALGVEFVCERINVPLLAQNNKIGIEDAARKARYGAFERFLAKNSDIGAIATAHNSTDNLETLIFNLMRGSGTRGLCGIKAHRDDIIRPLIYVSKKDVLALLNEAQIPFVTDKTNFSVEYTRNYIRHEIIPKLERLTPSPEEMALKAISALRTDSDYIDSEAKEFYDQNAVGDKLPTEKLYSLHPAILMRVLRLMIEKLGAKDTESVHFDGIKDLIYAKRDFEFHLPNNNAVFSDKYYTYVINREELDILKNFEYNLREGFNEIPELGMAIAVSNNKDEDFSSNVYKFSIQADLSSAIIVGRLSVRTKRDGDTYYYGGMTRKVKKLLCDKKIPPKQRNTVPIITDEKGIVWIPGLGVRDDGAMRKEKQWITAYFKEHKELLRK